MHCGPIYLETKHKKRKAWAKAFLVWRADDWRHFFFSDESKLQIFGLDGMEWCWRKPNEHLNPRFTKKQVKHGRGKVTVWGHDHSHGLGRLIRIEGRMDAAL